MQKDKTIVVKNRNGNFTCTNTDKNNPKKIIQKIRFNKKKS